MDPEKKRIIRGVLFVLVGVLCIFYLIFMALVVFEPLEIISLPFIAMEFLAIAFILAGIFSIRPAKTHKGKMILGLTSMIFGAVIFLLPLINVLIIISSIESTYRFTYLIFNMFNISIYLISGIKLLVHGIYMFRRNYTPGMLKRDL